MTIKVDSPFGGRLQRKGLSEPLSLYVHVPFCNSKCPYCAFASAIPKPGDVNAWLDALSRELDYWWNLSGGTISARTLYFGGGTPSLLSSSHWQRLWNVLSGYVIIPDDCEISVEANPDSLTVDHLMMWRDWNFKRISIGVQSFDDEELKWLGRTHSSAMAKRAIIMALDGGFQVSGDLMFGLAGQDVRKWHSSLSRMISLGVHHVSLYQLMLEEKSYWGDHPPEDVQNGYAHYRWSQWYLRHKGYDQYEIASFARDGFTCRHNQAYWERANVLGLGPSAWGYIEGLRYSNAPSLKEYISTISGQGNSVNYEEKLSLVQCASEAAILALRTKWGIDIEDYRNRFGTVLADRLIREIEAIPSNCAVWREGAVALSPKGMRVANAIWERLLWEDNDG